MQVWGGPHAPEAAMSDGEDCEEEEEEEEEEETAA